MKRAGVAFGLVLALFGASCPRAVPSGRGGVEALFALSLPMVGPAAFRPGQLAGQVVLVRFFATWCFPCLADLPVLEKLQKDNAAQGFSVLAVGLDLEGAKVLEPWAEQYALPFPVLVADERLRGGETSFGRIRALPSTFVFGRDGELLFAFEGVASPERLLEAVRKAVER